MAKNHISMRIDEETYLFCEALQEKYGVERTVVLQYLLNKSIDSFKVWDFKRFLKELKESD